MYKFIYSILFFSFVFANDISNQWPNEFSFLDNIKDINFTKKELAYIEAEKKVRVCSYPTSSTFYNKDKSFNVKSLSLNFLDALLQRLGIEKEYVYTKTWKQSLDYIQNNKCDLIGLLQKNEQREKYLNFTSAFLHYPVMIITKNDTPYMYNLDILDKKKVVFIKKHAAIKTYKQRHPHSKIVLVDSFIDGINEVKSDEAFGYIDVFPSLIPILKEHKELKINRKLDFGLFLSIGIQKDNMLLYNILEKVLLNISSVDKHKIIESLVNVTYEKDTDFTYIWKILFVFILIAAFILYKNFELKRCIKRAIVKTKEQEILLNYYSKQDAMKDLVCNISHQWRQPINELSSNIMYLETKQFLNEEIPKDELKQKLTQVNKILNFLGETIDTFSNFYSNQKINEQFNLITLIDNVIFICKTSFEKYNIKIDFKNNYLDIKIMGNEIQQVLLAIFNNIINICKDRDIKDCKIEIKVYNSGKNTILEIYDNCGGIKEDINKIFDFMHSSTGTGLGLYISKRIMINKYNGTISAENTKDGVCFKLIFPDTTL